MVNNNQPICKTNSFGDKFWFLDSRLHREDGPAVEYANGYKAWYLRGQRHRINGPAVEHGNGNKEWYVYGKCHRLDGPAMERIDGFKFWHYQNKYIECSSQEEFERIIKLKALW